jgi:hypothetical protein
MTREHRASSEHRRLLPSMSLLLLVFSVLTALGATSLYLLPEETDRLFAWTIQPPLTAAFLGGGYLAGCVLVVLSRRDPVWAHNRNPLLTILLFTAVSLLATLLHLDRFHFGEGPATAQFAAWLWLVVYVVVPIALLVLLLPQERAPGADPPPRRPVPVVLRAALGVQSLLMLTAGTVLLVAPAAADDVWPWTLTPLTARAVSAWLIAFGAATALAAAGRDDLRRLRTATVAYAVFGVAQLVSLLRFRDTVAWDRPVAWVLTATMLSLAATGVAGYLAARDEPADVAGGDRARV